MSADRFKAELNDEQYRAVTAGDGPALVLAAAGTGKTRTLVYRVAHLVKRGTPPGRILLLTFTNRAAREMLERADRLVGTGVSGLWGGTFHHMANRILRRFAPRLGYASNYAILDSDDSRRVMAACLKRQTGKPAELPKPAAVLALVGIAANQAIDLERIVEAKAKPMNIDPALILDLRDDYVRRKRELGAMDFDDLLVQAAHLLRTHDDVRAIYQDLFDYVLVDEYQDTNPIQADMVDILAARRRNIMVVGDDFQSIYSWRGADLQNILSFPKRYPETAVFMLETNYRSSPEILALANACIRSNADQFQKTLRPTRPSTGRPLLFRQFNGEEQADNVLQTVMNLRRNGVPLSQMAVLYRAHYHALDLEKLLPRRRIPYRITSGLRFYEQAHIKDSCSVLQVALQRANGVAFERLLCLLPGTGEKTVAKIWDELENRFDASCQRDRDLVGARLRPAARAAWRTVSSVLEEFWDAASVGVNRAGRLVERFVNEFYREHAFRVYDNAESRMEDIDGLLVEIERFDDAEAFLSDMALQSNLDAELSEHEDGDHLLLSTIHQAKGKEWTAVILLWVCEGMFPSPRSLGEDSTGEAEERRLFYVAVTRAKERLILNAPKSRFVRGGGYMPCTPSRFIAELPKHLLSPVPR